MELSPRRLEDARRDQKKMHETVASLTAQLAFSVVSQIDHVNL